jgi:hypothetical protein
LACGADGPAAGAGPTLADNPATESVAVATLPTGFTSHLCETWVGIDIVAELLQLSDP